MTDRLAKSQEIFELIVLHNKLMSESDLKFFLSQTPDPEEAIQRIVASNFVDPGTAKKLMHVYRKKLAKIGGDSGTIPAPVAAPAITPAPASSVSPEPVATSAPVAAPVAPAPGEPAFDDDGAIPVPGFEAAAPAAPASAPAAMATSAAPMPTVTLPEGDVIGPRIEIGDGGRTFVHMLLKTARGMGASDVYIKSQSPAIVRIFSRLKNLNMDPIPAEVAEQSLLAIVTDGQHKDFKDTNDLDFSYDGGPELGRFRANFYRHLRGVDGVFRLIPETIRTFDELGLPEVIKKLISYKVGIVLVTGPKSSGKTTTTAALVDLINRTRPDHVVMMEDPIEFVQPCRLGHINQREVGPHTRSFANAMRAVLREAPDVIMVGEMRDLETTSLAITAAETGHLVISTLHTADAVRTIGRLLDVFPPREQPQIRAMVSESLRGVISQQLIPRADNTGMALALEIMINTTAIANLIRDDRAYQMPGVIQTGKKWGMQLMDESLIELAREGVITTHEAVARAVEVGRVKKELRVT